MSPRRQGVLRPSVGPKDHQAGPDDAPATLVEYGDFECPYCYRAHPIVMEAQSQLGSRLRFVFRNFPMTEIHPHALAAAMAAESVNAANGAAAYWRMHHSLFERQQDSPDALDDEHLLRYAAEAGAHPEQVAADLESNAFEERVKADFISGVRSGVNGTPTFFINGRRWDGDWTEAGALAAALERAADANLVS